MNNFKLDAECELRHKRISKVLIVSGVILAGTLVLGTTYGLYVAIQKETIEIKNLTIIRPTPEEIATIVAFNNSCKGDALFQVGYEGALMSVKSSCSTYRR